MKQVVFVILFLISTFAFAKEVPVAPSNCFSGKSYCSGWNVLTNSEGKKVIRVRIFAKLSISDMGSLDDVEGFFFDFSKWKDYAAGSENISILDSELRYVRVNGQERKRHFVRYSAKAPWPIRNMNVVDLMEYKIASADYPATLKSYTFRQVPGFSDREGVKYNIGELHIVKTSDLKSYLVTFVTDVVPSIDLLPKVAAPYIQRPMLDVFKGMFNL